MAEPIEPDAALAAEFSVIRDDLAALSAETHALHGPDPKMAEMVRPAMAERLNRITNFFVRYTRPGDVITRVVHTHAGGCAVRVGDPEAEIRVSLDALTIEPTLIVQARAMLETACWTVWNRATGNAAPPPKPARGGVVERHVAAPVSQPHRRDVVVAVPTVVASWDHLWATVTRLHDIARDSLSDAENDDITAMIRVGHGRSAIGLRVATATKLVRLLEPHVSAAADRALGVDAEIFLLLELIIEALAILDRAAGSLPGGGEWQARFRQWANALSKVCAPEERTALIGDIVLALPNAERQLLASVDVNHLGLDGTIMTNVRTVVQLARALPERPASDA